MEQSKNPQNIKLFFSSEEIKNITPDQIQKVVHDLQVHQIELEMQNEQLRDTHEELNYSKEKYFDLYNNAPIGYLTLTSSGKIVSANLTISNLLGITRENLINKDFSNFIKEDCQNEFYFFFKSLFSETPQKSFSANEVIIEIEFFKRTGETFWGRLQGSLFTEPQTKDSLCRLVVIDITEQKNLAYELEKTQKLESLGTLAGGIAHDFNNYLCAISNCIDIATDQITHPASLEYLEKAQSVIVRAHKLTEQLLTFAKGGMPVKSHENIESIIIETAELSFSGSPFTYKVEIQNNLKSVLIDKSQIIQVLMNVFANARESMIEAGSILINAKNVSKNFSQDSNLFLKDYIEIQVIDSGMGIPNDLICKIFDPFFTTKQNAKGIGLSTCYSIIKKHEGYINTTPNKPAGTIVHIYLPAMSVNISETKNISSLATSPTYKGSGIFVILDDEKIIRETLGKMLESFGYSVILKTCGEDAIQYFEEAKASNTPISGAIFDLTIPGAMGGKEAVSVLRKLQITTPIFVASGYSEDPVMENPAHYGFTFSISKPFRKTQIIEMLKKFL